ncbi:tyrosine-protein phosphatase [Marinococcus luteus]|uniref:tyrosine-protein phosphatase n=1 Tax=Marinococcus luteus TaxID=1122204 RepID=UPI002ACC4483|nr:CpsB/CapC family capsule biosynthesis tyrosine phosphatase [Marinococcus luteus]MDZ5784225.1 CpsB/CapC family capsule biosynthesis tyrosine phosphatase [Marinococcus luteus]
MIDIHTHILPGLDHGPEAVSESIAIAKEAAANNIQTVFATPHYRPGVYDNDGLAVKESVLDFNVQLRAESIPLHVKSGHEITLYKEMVHDLLSGQLLPLEDTNCVLVEMQTGDTFMQIKALFYSMQLEGYIPIMTHPERLQSSEETDEPLYYLVSHGALAQVSAEAVAGRQGWRRQRFALKLLRKNLAHFIASQADSVPFRLKPAYEQTAAVLGLAKARELQENTKRLLVGSPAFVEPPEPLHKKRVFFKRM